MISPLKFNFQKIWLIFEIRLPEYQIYFQFLTTEGTKPIKWLDSEFSRVIDHRRVPPLPNVLAWIILIQFHYLISPLKSWSWSIRQFPSFLSPKEPSSSRISILNFSRVLDRRRVPSQCNRVDSLFHFICYLFAIFIIVLTRVIITVISIWTPQILGTDIMSWTDELI